VKKKIISVLVEGGGKIFSSFIKTEMGRRDFNFYLDRKFWATVYL
jgi:hypothetical protein